MWSSRLIPQYGIDTEPALMGAYQTYGVQISSSDLQAYPREMFAQTISRALGLQTLCVYRFCVDYLRKLCISSLPPRLEALDILSVCFRQTSGEKSQTARKVVESGENKVSRRRVKPGLNNVHGELRHSSGNYTYMSRVRAKSPCRIFTRPNCHPAADGLPDRLSAVRELTSTNEILHVGDVDDRRRCRLPVARDALRRAELR